VNIEVLREEISIQLELMEATVREIESLQTDLGSRKPTTREVAAAAAFLADFYTGVENILKRISRCYGIPLPAGEDWHVELFNRFCEPGFQGLPIIFDANDKRLFGRYRSFRHVIRHGYAMQLDWERMAKGVNEVSAAYSPLRAKLHALFGV
jgi:hypothetical protein